MFAFDFGHQIILAPAATRQYFTTTGLVKSSSVSFGAETVLRFLLTVVSIADQVTILKSNKDLHKTLEIPSYEITSPKACARENCNGIIPQVLSRNYNLSA